MGGERQGPKVGGFFQLFDWNAKSRKKLFSSKFDQPEHSKQGKKGDGNFPASRIRMVEEYETGTFSNKGSSDYSCASSVTDEEGHASKAPNVVARLMGLDSLPKSNSVEPYSSPFFDTQSLNEFQFRRKDMHFYQEHEILNSGKFFNEAESLPRNKMEPKYQKSLSGPIEKFQREVLPPKLAKSIPITQHKLLSPIKKPGFVQSNDVAHIMEAAARIIEPGPQANARSRISSAGSSSVPLKVRELKEKTVESNAAKSLKGQLSLNRSWNGSVGTSFKAESSGNTKNKGKSINLAIQAKVNVQRREGLNPNRNGMDGMKEDDASGLTQFSKSESSSQKITAHKKLSVLRQNNQKQNFNSGKENVQPSKSSATNNVHGKKVVSGDSSHGRQRNLYKGSKKSSSDKDALHSGPRNVTRKKRSIDGKLQDVRNDGGGESMLIDKKEKENISKPNSVTERRFPWAGESRKKGADVVSFTFTTPMAQSGGIELPKQPTEERNSIFADNRSKKFMLRQEDMKLSSLGYDVVGDSLSVLLEQKLRELKNESSSASAWQNSNMFFEGSKTERLQDKSDPQEMQMDSMYSQMLSNFSSTETSERYDLEGGEMDLCSSTKVDNRKLYNCQQPVPVPILDSFDLTESFNSSSDSTGSNMTEESKMQCSYDQGQEMVNLSCLGKIHDPDTEMDISDSASSSKDESCFKAELAKPPTEWELDYIKDILSNVELMFKDCASGRTRDIINPHLFDQMERKRGSSSSYKDAPFAEKKVLFDCVRERLDVRCQRFVGGGFSALEKGLALVRRKEKLAEEVYWEIQEWRRMRNCMVDELVDKDMSIEHGKWQDFVEDGFGIGVDVDAKIFDGLVDEAIDDILGVSCCNGSAGLLSSVIARKMVSYM